MAEGRVGKVPWLCGVTLGMAGCASPQVMIKNLPLAGGARGTGTSILHCSGGGWYQGSSLPSSFLALTPQPGSRSPPYV